MRVLILIISLCVNFSPAAYANQVVDFYRGKTFTIYIGYGVGGAYDLYARTIGRHLGRHIPGGPVVQYSNMPGASTMVLANYLAKIAPPDGLQIGAVNSALLFDPLFTGSETKAQFKGPDIATIGNAASSAAVLFTWKDSGVEKFEDLYKKDLVIGAMTRTGDTYVIPAAIKKILLLDRLRIVTGYPGTREAALALERGEITGRVWDMDGIRSTKPNWLTDKQIHIIAQLAREKMPEVPPQVPLIMDFIPREEDRQALNVIFLSTLMARPYIAPPNTPDDRLQALRKAFMETMNDPAFLSDAEKVGATISPMSGEDMKMLVEGAYRLPQEVIKRVRDLTAE